MHLCGSSLNIPRVPSVLPLPRNPHVSLTLGKVHNPYSLWPWVLDTLTFESVSHHSCVHFLDNSASKSALRLRCFYNFYSQKCLAPQAVFFNISIAKVDDSGFVFSWLLALNFFHSTMASFLLLFHPAIWLCTRRFSHPILSHLSDFSHCCIC